LSDKARQAAEDEKQDKRLDEMLDEVVEELHTKLNKWQRTMVKRRTKLKLRKTNYEEKYNDLRKARDEFVVTTRKDLDHVIKSEARHGIGN
jgi:NAD+--asparagine ADP-ribosyltransferase